MKALIVDDSAVVRMFNRKILEIYDFAVVEAQNGEEAVAAFEHAFNAEKFDLILMDYEMPVMNGLEAMEKIRLIEKKSTHPFDQPKLVFLLMLTSMEDPMLLVNAYKKGRCNGYIIKSHDPSELMERLKK